MKKIKENMRKMRIFILVAILALCGISSASAVAIRDINIIENKDSIDIDFVLDSAFENRIEREDSNGYSAFVLKNVDLLTPKITKSTKIIRHIEIFKKDKDVYVVFADNDIISSFNIVAKSFQANLKITISPLASIATNLAQNSSLESAIGRVKNQTINEGDSTITKRPSGIDTWRYMLVMAILLSLIIALVVIKKRLYKKSATSFPCFKKPSLNVAQSIPIDSKNKILVLESRDSKYMLFVGEHNSFIIDKVDNLTIDENIGKLLQSSQGNKLSYFLQAYENEAKKHT